jgi:hypothetical protein
MLVLEEVGRVSGGHWISLHERLAEVCSGIIMPVAAFQHVDARLAELVDSGSPHIEGAHSLLEPGSSAVSYTIMAFDELRSALGHQAEKNR